MADKKTHQKSSPQKISKTRWSCLVIALVVVLILGGGGYLFYSYVFPVIQEQLGPKTTYTPAALNKEGKDKIQNVQEYGQPISDSEQTGRADPFAPI